MKTSISCQRRKTLSTFPSPEELNCFRLYVNQHTGTKRKHLHLIEDSVPRRRILVRDLQNNGKSSHGKRPNQHAKNGYKGFREF